MPWLRGLLLFPRRASALCCACVVILGSMLSTVVADGSERIEIYPPQITLVGHDDRQQLLVTLTTDNGHEHDVSRTVQYRSTQPAVAVVSSTGVVTPIGSGSTEIIAAHNGQQSRATVHVQQGDQYLPLDFTRDVLPLMTKGGCNGGGCHGKSGGRGGFQLSLFGFDPRGDYDAIVKTGRGRRLFPASPDNSLLLSKPANRVPHGGGTRLAVDTPEYERLRRWIATGTPWSNSDASAKPVSPLVRLEIAPAVRALDHREQQQIVVMAVYADGLRRDVTRTTEFRSNDASVADVNEHGLASMHERLGETAIVAIHRGHVGVCRLLTPLRKPGVPEPQLPIANLVDEHVLAKLRLLNVPPSGQVDDAGFLRRAMLQIVGQTPTADEVNGFVADSTPDKRAQLIERLLASGAHADYFAQKWGDILRIKRRNVADRLPATIAFHRWLRNAIVENRPYDEIVRQVITATGNPSENPAAQWYHEVRYLDRYVDDTAQVFLGVRIGCARCHNHPFENFTQEDYYGLAAYFARIGRQGGAGIEERKANESIFIKASGEVKHPGTGDVVPPHGLGAKVAPLGEFDDPRHALVDWMREPTNPYFARGLVNRMWAHFFGRGLVEPLDDQRVTNPAANEPLLDALAADFIQHNFDLRHLLKTICTSSTYGLSSTPNEWNLADTQFNSRFYPQRMSAEVLVDAVDRVTQIKTNFTGLPEGTRATQLPDEGFANNFMNLFGRPPRESACECERVAAPSLSQSLFLMNDQSFLSKINTDKSLADQLGRGPEDAVAKIQRLFVTVLSRKPTEQELKASLEHINSEEKPILAYRNLLWVLLNTKEFLYIH
ncbi:MAG: DUF1553 domain-containing protein [Planctomycetaceae bacterium]|nr:DUF1553 domain-containing protein [Planctomycetaceae bacterium]